MKTQNLIAHVVTFSAALLSGSALAEINTENLSLTAEYGVSDYAGAHGFNQSHIAVGLEYMQPLGSSIRVAANMAVADESEYGSSVFWLGGSVFQRFTFFDGRLNADVGVSLNAINKERTHGWQGNQRVLKRETQLVALPRLALGYDLGNIPAEVTLQAYPFASPVSSIAAHNVTFSLGLKTAF